MIVGFSWMGWVLGGTAERQAMERSNTAVVVALTPVCTSKFMGQPNAAAKLKERQVVESWKQQALARGRLPEPLTAPRW
jgi:hypothetical protein